MGLVGAVAAGLYAVDPTDGGWVLAIGAATLMVFGWAVALFVIGLVLQYGETAEVFSWGTLVLLMPLSGIFYPPEALPGVLQPVAQVVPLTRIFEATPPGLEGGGVQWGDLGIGIAGSLVCVAAGDVVRPPPAPPVPRAGLDHPLLLSDFRRCQAPGARQPLDFPRTWSTCSGVSNTVVDTDTRPDDDVSMAKAAAVSTSGSSATTTTSSSPKAK